MNKLLIGSHCGMNGPDFFLGTVKEAISYGSSTFMFYTGAPQNSFRKPLNECKIEEGLALAKEYGFDLSKIVVHAPYIVNLSSNNDKEKWENACKFIIQELKRTQAFGATTIVLHPGSHVKMGAEHGINTLAQSLDYILSKDGTEVKIAIETMAGKGDEIGITFEQVNEVINKCKYKDRVGVCLDTCHINDAGYEVSDTEHVLDEFDRIIGLNRLLVVHVNDSKNPKGSHKDRHENIGYGEIGFETLNKYVNNPRLVNIPKILETPYINEKPPYKKEIEMFKEGKFVPNWKESF